MQVGHEQGAQVLANLAKLLGALAIRDRRPASRVPFLALVPAFVQQQSRLWLPAWPAGGWSTVKQLLQRGFASGPEGGSGNGHPPPDQTRHGSNATPADQPQPSQQQSGSASAPSSMGPAQSSDAAGGSASPPLEAVARGALSSGGVAGSLPAGGDGPRGDMTSVVVPSEQLEYEADALLDAWEPLMAQVRALSQCIVCAQAHVCCRGRTVCKAE